MAILNTSGAHHRLRTIVATTALGGSAVLMIGGYLYERQWWILPVFALVIFLLVREWRDSVRSEQAQTDQNRRSEALTWWNLAGYCGLFGYLAFMLLGQIVWHISDLIMLTVAVPALIMLGMWVIGRYKLSRWT